MSIFSRSPCFQQLLVRCLPGLGDDFRFLRIRRLRLDSGCALTRQSSEFMLNFTSFCVKAASDDEVDSRPRDSRGTRAVRTWKADITLRLVSGRHRFGVCVDWGVQACWLF